MWPVAGKRSKPSQHQVVAFAASTSGRGFDAPLSDRVNPTKEARTAKEYFKMLGDTVGKMLKGVPVYLVGDDGDGNAAVAEEVAPVLGYVPFQSAKLIQQTTGKGLASIAAEEGLEGVAEAEASIVRELSTFVRCAVGTIGGGQGAAADPARWNHLHGGVSVWLDCSSSGSKRDDSLKGPQHLGYTKCDIVVRFSLPEGATWQPTVTRAVSEGVLEGIKKLLTENENYAGKKSLYIRSGCRGDWPDLAEPGAEVTPQSVSQNSGPVKEVLLGQQNA
ncbi:shikimate kinase-like protein [Klebsormidium nitens]|uniref:Shikimate kinase-like protein n=1 Tax=Klebsormidium nitens TaxID=105231 RepID=A0A1Y1IAM5_KLENI|nr:shikimate kinase-like protein [Klebsormidium nitens]|eukprot:GAQ88015.1 shikimate kinase-like protein [Klebsormidium nitens]